jgi:hypothetical protein
VFDWKCLCFCVFSGAFHACPVAHSVQFSVFSAAYCVVWRLACGSLLACSLLCKGSGCVNVIFFVLCWLSVCEL